MNAPDFAKHLGVSAAAVTKALRSGQLDSVVKWEVHGKRRTATFTSLQRAVELWMSRPGARAPALERRASKTPRPEPTPDQVEVIPYAGEPSSELAGERLRFERFRAKNEQLQYERDSGSLISVERAKEIYGRHLSEIRNGIMAMGKHMRSRFPELTMEHVMGIEELGREVLEGHEVS